MKKQKQLLQLKTDELKHRRLPVKWQKNRVFHYQTLKEVVRRDVSSKKILKVLSLLKHRHKPRSSLMRTKSIVLHRCEKLLHEDYLKASLPALIFMKRW